MKILIIASNSVIAQQVENEFISIDPYLITFTTVMDQIEPAYLLQMWDYVVVVLTDGVGELPTFTGKVRGFIRLPYQADPEQLNRSLYTAYRDVILAGDGSTCACGANTYCKCH